MVLLSLYVTGLTCTGNIEHFGSVLVNNSLNPPPQNSAGSILINDLWTTHLPSTHSSKCTNKLRLYAVSASDLNKHNCLLAYWTQTHVGFHYPPWLGIPTLPKGLGSLKVCASSVVRAIIDAKKIIGR